MKYFIVIIQVFFLLSCGLGGSTGSGKTTKPTARREQEEAPGKVDPVPTRSANQGQGRTKGPNQTPPKPPADLSKLSGVCRTVVEEYSKLDDKGGFSFEDVKKTMIDEFTKTHNYVRRLYGLSDLVWDDEIADYAQKWADYLKDKHNCKKEHRQNLGRKDGKSWGENLAWFKRMPAFNTPLYLGSARESVLAWAEECKDFTYDTSACTAGEQCGHFTQVVWSKSQRFGCGVTYCPMGEDQEELWVCNYDPPGNTRTIYDDGMGGKRIVIEKPY